mmetsp:Transcript_36347/g.81939  ORF Transcript_36347/g.81939 Transcript_36347/m.81939 type:complete len:240 (-) Transcript_36347:304-1023(-)
MMSTKAPSTSLFSMALSSMASTVRLACMSSTVQRSMRKPGRWILQQRPTTASELFGIPFPSGCQGASSSTFDFCSTVSHRFAMHGTMEKTATSTAPPAEERASRLPWSEEATACLPTELVDLSWAMEVCGSLWRSNSMSTRTRSWETQGGITSPYTAEQASRTQPNTPTPSHKPRSSPSYLTAMSIGSGFATITRCLPSISRTPASRSPSMGRVFSAPLHVKTWGQSRYGSTTLTGRCW